MVNVIHARRLSKLPENIPLKTLARTTKEKLQTNSNSINKYKTICTKLRCNFIYHIDIVFSARRYRKKLISTKINETITKSQYNKVNNIKGISLITHKSQLQRNNIELFYKNEPKEYTGVVDISCITGKNQDTLLSELKKVLNTENIKIYKEDNWEMNCYKGLTEFNIEIMKIDELSYLRINRLKNDDNTYNEIAKKLLTII